MARRCFDPMTDGLKLTVDRQGRWTRSKRQVELEALTHVLRRMQEVPAEMD
jgi:hypothetical protein